MATWTIGISSLLFFLTSFEERKASPIEVPKKDCYRQDLEIKDDAVLKKLGEYMKNVEPYALPIISILNNSDSSHVYLTATIAANTIKNSPPSYIATFNDRDIAVYNGSKSLEGECLTTLVDQYRQILYIDLANKRKGYAPGEQVVYSYDPVCLKITLFNHKIVSIKDSYTAVGPTPHYKITF